MTGQVRSWREILCADGWTLAAAFVAAWHFASFPWHDHPIVTDVRYFLYFAQQTAGGALPHVDFFDNKTPLSTFLGAALYRLGHRLGVEPLYAIRWGYLALAAVAAVLSFIMHRTLGGGRAACGAFALSFHCGFWLLGLMPCIGNIPKLAMAALAAASALCVHREAWVAAGLLGGLAALDWQIGALAVLGAFAAACWRPSRERRAAAARVALGAALAALPLLAVYGSRGALDALFRQTVEASLFRGAATLDVASFGDEGVRRWRIVAGGTEGHTWLVAVAALGVPAYVLWLRSPRARAMRGLVAALGIYHFGVAGFSLWDFQAYGDLFALLHTACFFAAIAASEAFLILTAGTPGARRWIGPAVATIACLAVSRPWVGRGSLRERSVVASHATLETQRGVAGRLAPLLARPTTAVRGAAEQLFLTGTRNPLPFVVWNRAVYSYFRRGSETSLDTLARLQDEARLRRLVCDRPSLRCAALASYRLADTVGDPSVYAVDVYERRPGPRGAIRGTREP